jgi:hypothetical protein
VFVCLFVLFVFASMYVRVCVCVCAFVCVREHVCVFMCVCLFCLCARACVRVSVLPVCVFIKMAILSSLAVCLSQAARL